MAQLELIKAHKVYGPAYDRLSRMIAAYDDILEEVGNKIERSYGENTEELHEEHAMWQDRRNDLSGKVRGMYSIPLDVLLPHTPSVVAEMCPRCSGDISDCEGVACMFNY